MKTSKIITYVAIAIAAYCVIVFNSSVNAPQALKIIGYVLIGLVVLSMIAMFVALKLLKKQNEIIYKLIDEEKYQEAIQRAKQKLDNKKTIAIRRNFYTYLIVLCYVSLNDKEKAYEYAEKITLKGSYPAVYYWKICIEFSEGNYENIKDYYNSFVNSEDYINRMRKYISLSYILNAINSYIDSNYAEAREFLSNPSFKMPSMPCSKRAVAIILDSLENKDEEVVEKIEVETQENIENN